jgi:hypothetical protein
MSQWRGMAAPGSKPRVKAEALVPRLSTYSYISPAIGLDDLRKRGWTIVLVQRHLGDEDRRDAVSHWANFSGKKVYLLAK